MQRLIGLKDRFRVAFACDPDHDRHGIVTRSAGLLPPNHYLSVAIFYLFQHRPAWRPHAAVGKTVVSSQMIDRVAAKLGRTLYEVPVVWASVFWAGRQAVLYCTAGIGQIGDRCWSREVSALRERS